MGAWPAVALVGSYELFMMIIRGAQQPAGDVPPETEQAAAAMPEALQAQAAEEFADEMMAGRMPSIRPYARGFTWDSRAPSWCARTSSR